MNKTNFKLVVFDLDGTLIRSHNTIYESMKFAMRELGIKKEPDKDIFMGVIGHHFNEIFDALGIVVEDYDRYMSLYKSKYFDFIDASTFYPGVLDTIKWLKEKGFKVALLTTKAQDQADLIIKHCKLNEYFDNVTGRRSGVANKPDAEPLLNICAQLGIDPVDTLMVGDSELDVQCGKNAGATACAVAYGYRGLNLLIAENPEFIINDMNELKNILNHSE